VQILFCAFQETELPYMINKKSCRKNIFSM